MSTKYLQSGNKLAQWNAFRAVVPILQPSLAKASLKEKRALYVKLRGSFADKGNGDVGSGFLSIYQSYIAKLNETAEDGTRKVPTPLTNKEFYAGLTKSLADESFSDKINNEWNANLAQSNAEDVGPSAAVGMVEGGLAKDTATKPDPSLFGQAQAAGGLNSAAAGSYVDGLGVKGMDGSLGKGTTVNAGGGRLDTAVGEDGDGNDKITQGPQSADVATKTLRPKLAQPAGEEVRPSIQEDTVSNALFESFSWVPEGFGLGANNTLGLQNTQNDSLRYGMETLTQPRRMESADCPHPVQDKWLEAMSLEQLERIYVEKVGKQMQEQESMKNETVAPSYMFDDDFNGLPSSKGLPRQVQGPSVYQPVVDTMRAFLPARDPAGLHMSHLPFQSSRRSTMGFRRLNTFKSLMQ